MMQDRTMSNPVDGGDKRKAAAALSAGAAAWAAFILAEAFPAGRNVAAAARQVPLLVAHMPAAAHVSAIFDRERLHGVALTITVDEYLHSLQSVYGEECPCWWWGAEDFCGDHEVAPLRSEIFPALPEILPVLPPLYAAAVAAAVGEVWPPLAAPETSDHQEEETADDKEAAGQRPLEP